MIAKINTINGINQSYELSENELIVNLKYPRKSIKILSLDGTSTIDELNYPVYDIESTDRFIFLTLENCSKSYFYNKEKKSIKELPYVLHIKGFRQGDKYLCYSEFQEEEVFLIVNLLSVEIVRKIDSNIGFGNVQLLQSESILSSRRKQGKIGSFDFNNNLVWQLDLSDLCSYDVGNGLEKAELSNIYTDDEFVYLLAGLSVVKVSIQSGDIIWHANLATAQSRGLVYGGYLYTTSNAYINKIDCQTGEILYQVGFDYFFIGNKKELGPIKELVWYQDSIWTVMDSNPSALIEINPSDGSYISVIPLKELGITRDCHMPRFHKNRMYLLDFDNTLHIFEMEKEL
jgi:hypothetical protein